MKRYYHGHNSLSHGSNEDRPQSVVAPENIDAVCELVLQVRHVTYREIDWSLGISINKILHQYLAVTTYCSRSIRHNLSQTQKDGTCRSVPGNGQEIP